MEEAKVLLLDMLGTATEAMSTNDISKKIAFNEGFDTKEGFDLERFQKIVFASLKRCDNNKLIERVGKDGLTILWQIKS